MKMKKFKWSSIPIYFLLISFALTIVLSFLLVVSVSLTSQQDISTYGFMLWPKKIDFSAYQYAFENMTGIFNAYKISIIYTVVGTFLSVLIMSMLAYALSRKEFVLRKGLAFYVFFTMLFSGGLTPSYILITQYLQIQNTIWVLILPTLVNCFHVIMLRTFFQQVPQSLFESAKLDGASEFRMFFNIAIPLSKSVIATVAFMGVITRWNDWFAPKLYISEEELYPIQYILQSMLANVQFALDMMEQMPTTISAIDVPQENLRMALMVITSAPMLFVFPFFQKYFVRGITVGSIKG